jgi:hypothetical protein
VCKDLRVLLVERSEGERLWACYGGGNRLLYLRRMDGCRTLMRVSLRASPGFCL